MVLQKTISVLLLPLHNFDYTIVDSERKLFCFNSKDEPRYFAKFLTNEKVLYFIYIIYMILSPEHCVVSITSLTSTFFFEQIHPFGRIVVKWYLRP